MKGKKANLIESLCLECEATFIHKDSKREINRKFCSGFCAKKNNGKKNIGKKRTEEFKNNKRENYKGEGNPFFGKHHTDKTKNKIGDANKWNSSRYRYCNLTYDEKEVLDGLLLSDASLSEKSRISARITFGFKFKKTLEDIFKELHSINFSPIWQSKHTKCYHSKSNMYHDLLDENKRWYPVKKKIVPKDVIITPKSCYWWFIGDGYITAEAAYLCTDSFTEDDNNFLINRLNEKGFNPSLTSKNRIRFNKKETIDFLEWIKPKDGIMEQYNYKWKI